jgi:hypothetical protein
MRKWLFIGGVILLALAVAGVSLLTLGPLDLVRELARAPVQTAERAQAGLPAGGNIAADLRPAPPMATPPAASGPQAPSNPGVVLPDNPPKAAARQPPGVDAGPAGPVPRPLAQGEAISSAMRDEAMAREEQMRRATELATRESESRRRYDEDRRLEERARLEADQADRQRQAQAGRAPPTVSMAPPPPPPPSYSPGVEAQALPPSASAAPPMISRQRESASTARALPEFPWPPPGASAWAEIPDELIAQRAAPRPTFGLVRDRLARALDAAGYTQRSFFRVPNGFAVVTQLERIGDDGVPARARWYVSAGVESFSLEQYLRRLLFAEAGRYRLVVLVVTDVSISASGPNIAAREAAEMADKGFMNLPAEVAAAEYSANHRSTALIYEFRKRPTGDPEFVKPSPLPGRDHLVKARIWAEIERLLR